MRASNLTSKLFLTIYSQQSVSRKLSRSPLISRSTESTADDLGSDRSNGTVRSVIVPEVELADHGVTVYGVPVLVLLRDQHQVALALVEIPSHVE